MVDPASLSGAIPAGVHVVALGLAWLLAVRWAGAFASQTVDHAEDRRLHVVVPIAGLVIGIVGGVRGGGAGAAGSALALAAACVLLVVAVVDARTRMIPLVAVAALVALGLTRAALVGEVRAAVLGGLAGFTVFGLLWVAARRSRPAPGPDPFGFGDVLLAISIGTATGWPSALGTLFLGAVLAAVYAAWLLLGRSATMTGAFPYGAFLCLAAIWVLLLGG